MNDDTCKTIKESHSRASALARQLHDRLRVSNRGITPEKVKSLYSLSANLQRAMKHTKTALDDIPIEDKGEDE